MDTCSYVRLTLYCCSIVLSGYSNTAPTVRRRIASPAAYSTERCVKQGDDISLCFYFEAWATRHGWLGYGCPTAIRRGFSKAVNAGGSLKTLEHLWQLTHLTIPSRAAEKLNQLRQYIQQLLITPLFQWLCWIFVYECCSQFSSNIAEGFQLLK